MYCEDPDIIRRTAKLGLIIVPIIIFIYGGEKTPTFL